MGKTKDLGHLAHIVAYNAENHITVPAGLTMHTNQLVASQAWVTTALGSYALSSSLGSYVPTSRTITINGTTYDLSANMSFTIAAGLTSFNTRTGAITLSSSDVTTALGFTPVTNARTITINGTTFDLTADRSYTVSAGTTLNGTGFVKASGTTISYDNSTYLTGITSALVTGALGFTPYNATNPSGYITGITSANVTTALGFTPYNATNPNGYITSSGSVTYATNSTRLYASDGVYVYGGAAPYYMSMTYDGTRWFLQVSPATPSAVRVSYADSAGSAPANGGNATTVGGLAVHTDRNNEANKIVRTDANGYIQAGWINTLSGDNGTSALTRIYASDDGYIRYYTPANFRQVLDVPTRTGGSASGTWGINISGNAATATSAATVTGSSTISGYLTLATNWGVSPYTSAFTIIGTHPSMTFRGSNGDTHYLMHMDSNGDIQYYFGPGHTTNNWTRRYEFTKSGNFNVVTGNISASGTVTGSNLSGTNTGDQTNISGRAGSTLNWFATSHPNDYYLVNNWTGTYWRITSNHPSGVQVAYADTAGSAPANGGTSSNTNSISNALGNTHDWVGFNYFYTNNGGQAVNNSNSAKLQAYSTGNNSAFMSFHRAGHYATNFGLDDDNYMRMGGWSAPANRWQLNMTSGDCTLSGFQRAVEFYTTGWFRNYGTSGLYQQDYGGHFARSTDGSFGTWQIWGGSRGGYAGLTVTDPSGYYHQLMFESGQGGIYSENGSGWTIYLARPNDCVGINGSETYDWVRACTNGKHRITNDSWCDATSWAYTFSNISDGRLKENIITVDSALDKVLQLRGVYYNWIIDTENKKHIGLIAQETAAVCPEVVNYHDETDTYSVNYSELSGLFVESTKELNQKLIDANARIELLETKLNQLLNA